VRLAGPTRRVGTDGLRISVDTSAGVLEGIGWGLAARMPRLDVAQRYDLTFRLERDEYRGVSRLQLKLADVRPSGLRAIHAGRENRAPAVVTSSQEL